MGIFDVALLMPCRRSCSRGRLAFEKGVLGPLVRWRWRTAARYVLMVCHRSPFFAKYAAKSIS